MGIRTQSTDRKRFHECLLLRNLLGQNGKELLGTDYGEA
jgi:hypothetical protein